MSKSPLCITSRSHPRGLPCGAGGPARVPSSKCAGIRPRYHALGFRSYRTKPSEQRFAFKSVLITNVILKRTQNADTLSLRSHHCIQVRVCARVRAGVRLCTQQIVFNQRALRRPVGLASLQKVNSHWCRCVQRWTHNGNDTTGSRLLGPPRLGAPRGGSLVFHTCRTGAQVLQGQANCRKRLTL